MSDMSVLLVHIPVGFEESYPLGLAAIAAPLINAGFTVDGLDVGRSGISGLAQRLDRGDVDVIGMGIWTPGAHQAREVSAMIRALPKAPYIVTGGPHATLCPEDVDTDCAVIGEGEATFTDVVEALAAGRSIDGIAGAQRPNGPKCISRKWLDLGLVPVPDRSVFAVSDYHREHLPRGRRFASAYTSRGCRHHCSYCSSPKLWGQVHRYRPAEQVVAEWRQLRLDHGVDGILIEDDLFTHDSERVITLCEHLIRESPGVHWELLNGIRPDSVDPKLLALMARAGCTRIAFGIETAGAKSLKRMGRTPDMAKVANLVRAAVDAGMSTTGYFMIGLPNETPTDRSEMFQWATTLPLDFAHFCQASAWPGTRWTDDELTPLPPRVRASLYARYYLHPGRARRLMRAMNLGWGSLVDLTRRWMRWVQRPIQFKGESQ